MALPSLDDLKIEIRSLLVSSPNGLSEDELCRDYALFNANRSLPYQVFGYSTRKHFLNSLTDTLYRSTDGRLHPIVNQSTAHIFKLVQQQLQKKKVRHNQQSRVNHSQPVPPPVRTEPKKPVPRRMHPTADTIKPSSMMQPTKRTCSNHVKQERPSVQFERIIVTNDLLHHLLRHFQRQQQRQAVASN